MRKLLYLALLLFTVSFSLDAQNTEREKEATEDLDYYNTDNDRVRDERGDDFGSNIWWGTGAQLGFSSNGASSFFQIGLSPIVGYKVNNFLSVGPRGSFAYNSFKEDRGQGNPEFKSKYWTWSAGAFARGKVIFPFFVHAEYSLESEVLGFAGNGDPVRVTRAIPYLGGGISQGGGPGGGAGYEIMILFRLSSADRLGDSPYQFRTGINFNF